MTHLTYSGHYAGWTLCGPEINWHTKDFGVLGLADAQRYGLDRVPDVCPACLAEWDASGYSCETAAERRRMQTEQG